MSVSRRRGAFFRERRPGFSLDPFDRASERYTKKQLRARDFSGREFVVAKLGIDGKVKPTTRSEAYFNAGQQLFVRAFVVSRVRGRGGALQQGRHRQRPVAARSGHQPERI